MAISLGFTNANDEISISPGFGQFKFIELIIMYH